MQFKHLPPMILFEDDMAMQAEMQLFVFCLYLSERMWLSSGDDVMSYVTRVVPVAVLLILILIVAVVIITLYWRRKSKRSSKSLQ